MATTKQLDLGRFEIKLGEYAVGTATCLSDPTILADTQDYRRRVAARMQPIGKADIADKIPKADFHVSRKVDGEFTVLVFQGGQAFSINPGGTVRVGLPWLTEAADILRDAGIENARIAGELYVAVEDRRARVHDVTRLARNPNSEEELERLRFAPFDIISLNDETPSEVYAESFQTLENLFAKAERICVVETEIVDSVSKIQQLFEKWVVAEDAEGLVARSDHAGQFKIKPRHSIDAVVIGFTESTEDRAGMLHDMLVAVMRADGTYHILGRVGGGFSEDERRTFLSDLKDMVVASEYVEVNSDYVAYQMVRPDWVVEISCLDLISQTTRGGHVNRMVLEYDESSSAYAVVRRMPLATVISPQFVRRREDKQSHPQDVRVAQVGERVEVSLIDADAKSFRLPKATVERREIYTKQLKGTTMVRKFVLVKTNKEQASDEFPAYVLHYTDFSPNRKEPLAREVTVSNSKSQIDELFEQYKKDNIKKGWSASVPAT